MIRARFSRTFISPRLYVPSKQMTHQMKANFDLYRMVYLSLVSFSIVKEYQLNGIFPLYFLNWNFSLNIKSTHLKSLGYIDNILMKETVSQNYDIGHSFYSFFFFSRFHKIKTKP